MATLDLVALLLAWVAIFSLIVVIPWVVVRVIVVVLESDYEAIIDRWTPSIPRPGQERRDTTETAMIDDEWSVDSFGSESDHSDHDIHER